VALAVRGAELLEYVRAVQQVGRLVPAGHSTVSARREGGTRRAHGT
jgi:hypothetical protein